MLPRVRHPAAFRRELREHQRGRGRIAAEFLERARTAVQHPVIAASALPPNGLCVREDQQMGFIRRPGVVRNAQGFCFARRSQLRRADQHGALSACRCVTHNLLRVLHGGRRLERGVGIPLFEPTRRAKPFRLELIGFEHPAEKLLHFRLDLRRSAWRESQQRSSRNAQKKKPSLLHDLPFPYKVTNDSLSRSFVSKPTAAAFRPRCSPPRRPPASPGRLCAAAPAAGRRRVPAEWCPPLCSRTGRY